MADRCKREFMRGTSTKSRTMHARRYMHDEVLHAIPVASVHLYKGGAVGNHTDPKHVTRHVASHRDVRVHVLKSFMACSFLMASLYLRLMYIA